MWNLKYNTNESIYKRGSQTYRTDLWLSTDLWLAEKERIGSLGLADANYYI